MTTAPQIPNGPRASPPSATPTSTAQSGSVPIRMLARAADVRRTAQSCTTKAKTEQSRPRKRTSSQPDRITGVAGDPSNAHDRVSLAAVAGEVDILINNAGIQRRVGLAEDQAAWKERQRELDLLLAAPMHLTDLLLPAMLRRGRPALR